MVAGVLGCRAARCCTAGHGELPAGLQAPGRLIWRVWLAARSYAGCTSDYAGGPCLRFSRTDLSLSAPPELLTAFLPGPSTRSLQRRCPSGFVSAASRMRCRGTGEVGPQ